MVYFFPGILSPHGSVLVELLMSFSFKYILYYQLVVSFTERILVQLSVKLFVFGLVSTCSSYYQAHQTHIFFIIHHSILEYLLWLTCDKCHTPQPLLEGLLLIRYFYFGFRQQSHVIIRTFFCNRMRSSIFEVTTNSWGYVVKTKPYISLLINK